MTPSNILHTISVPFLVILLSGCVVGPDYRTPVVDVPSSWRATPENGVRSGAPVATDLSKWWDTLDDPLLSRLETEAVANNLDLQQARARLRESRARRRIAEGNRLPTVTAGAGAARNRSSAEMGSGVSRTSDSYSLQLDASWEADLFGGTRRALEAATATLEASQEDVRDVQVSLLAEVALTYLEVRTGQQQLDMVRATLATLEESARITVWRNQAGLVSQLDVEQARLNLEQTRARIPALLTSLEQSKNNLAFLVGRPSGAMAELDTVAPVPVPRAAVAIGVPAGTLRQRPDIRRAERQLAAATAQTGVAEAARYPDLSLSGTLGLQTVTLGTLLNSGAFVYSLAANTVMTVFDGGRLKQNVEIQNALQEQALITYQAAVRSAVRDVENALTAYAEEQNRLRYLTDAVTAARNAAELAGSQYSAGLIDYATVLDSQRSLLTAQEQRIQSEADVTSNLVRLYKALGGGWSPAPMAKDAPRITSQENNHD